MSRWWVVLGCASLGATTLTACDKLFDLHHIPDPNGPGGDARLDGIVGPPDAIAPCFGARVRVDGITDGLDPQMSDDRLEIIYAKGPGGDYDLYHGTRSTTAGIFAESELVSLNTGVEESDPSLTQDGLLIVFKSNRGSGQQVWQATRTARSNMFSTPMLVQGVENLQASGIDVSPDGNTLYIDDYGALFVTHRPSRTAPFGPAIQVSAAHVDYPSVTPNGLEVFSNGVGGYVRGTRATAADTDPFLGSDVIDAGANDGDVLPDNTAIVIVGGSSFYTLERCN